LSFQKTKQIKQKKTSRILFASKFIITFKPQQYQYFFNQYNLNFIIMGKPAARIGDMHVCPMVTPGTPPVPHVGGPIISPGVPTVLIGGLPAAVMGDSVTCIGPPDTIIIGSTGVFIGGKPAARMGDMTMHGGTITIGCPTVLIGESMPGGDSQVAENAFSKALSEMPEEAAAKAAQVVTLKNASKKGSIFTEICGGNK
jgi:uncharacterized Zn-binding protein involved in type VI secretion